MKDSSKIALSIVSGIVLGIILVVAFINYNEKKEKEMNEKLQVIYDKGYTEGYIKGKDDVLKQVEEFNQNKESEEQYNARNDMWENIKNNNK